ncbi:uncharacterized protein LOC8283653 [Ricinus communis]|uniref:Uncharacterized protein n=1 Tax=Ricinus communis TaxID=3988 RepID=B9S5I8_RICCO|nr:uncharacterized protein LOC8283653 [Ricinus communis]XP_015576058.1 uncharacterized protein LOC8283653 [Ricinus communis]EEF41113.1 conserved hypothetical protein [Ricinus communis]|eukprot:XP_002521257.1 uncharacterized protein LOC8283653 [Ricinus communis]
MKAVISGFPTSFSGLVTCHPKHLFGIQRCNGIRFKITNTIRPSQKNTGGGIQYFTAKPSSNKKVLSVGRDYYQLSYKDDSPQEPFLLSFIKEAIWAMKSLFIFLVEQPSQLKYIEWPSFHSTLKTAILTLVIVALLIVALSSVDSILCYLLAWLLRRPA